MPGWLPRPQCAAAPQRQAVLAAERQGLPQEVRMELATVTTAPSFSKKRTALRELSWKRAVLEMPLWFSTLTHRTFSHKTFTITPSSV